MVGPHHLKRSYRGKAESELRVYITRSAVEYPVVEDLGLAMVVRSQTLARLCVHRRNTKSEPATNPVFMERFRTRGSRLQYNRSLVTN